MTNQLEVAREGWSRRAALSEAWHYFRGGHSICSREWTDPQGPLLVRINGAGLVCPECVRRRLKELEA